MSAAVAAIPTDDPFHIPAFARRDMAAAVPANDTGTLPREIVMPASSKARTRKRPGDAKALAGLGYRPSEIRRIDRREADELVATETRAECWRRRENSA